MGEDDLDAVVARRRLRHVGVQQRRRERVEQRLQVGEERARAAEPGGWCRRRAIAIGRVYPEGTADVVVPPRPHRPLGARRHPRAQPRAARAAGRDRQLVRAPAGRAPRRRDGLQRDGVELRHPLRQREDADRAAARPSRRGPDGAAALRPGPRRSCARAAAYVAEHVPQVDVIDLNMGCPVPKVCKTGAGAAMLKDPDTAVAVARAAARGQRQAGDGQAALAARRPGDTSGVDLAHRLVDEAGVAAITFHPRSAKVHHKGVPDYDLAAELVASLPAPVILTGGLHTVAEVQDAYERTGAAAVMLARGSLGNPWLFEQLLGRRDDEPDRGRDPGRVALGHRPRRGASRAPSAPAATCASSTLGTSSASAGRKELHTALQQTATVAEARAVLARAASATLLSRLSAALAGRSRVAILPRSLGPEGRRRRLRARTGLSPSPHASRRHPHPRRPHQAQGRAGAPADRRPPRGRRADQGGAGVRRHLRELRVRRRQERAGDARGQDRPARGAHPRRDGRRPGGAVHRRRRRRLDRPRQGREDRQVAEVHDRRLRRGQPGRGQALQRVAGRPRAARPQAQRRRSPWRSPRARRGSSRSPRSTSASRLRADMAEPGREPGEEPQPKTPTSCCASAAPSSTRCAPRASTRSRRLPRRRADRRRPRRARGPGGRRGDRGDLPRRRPPDPAPRPGQDGVPGPRRPLRAHPAAGAPRRPRRGEDGAAARRARPRRHHRRRRHRVRHPARRAEPARRRLHRAGQGAAPAARRALRPARRRDPLPPARARPDGLRGGARAVRHARQDRLRGPPLPRRRAASSRSRRRSCSRSTAARRPGRSPPTSTRWTATSTCGSRPSCTSSA